MLNKLSFNIFNELNESETEKYKIKKKVLIESNGVKTINENLGLVKIEFECNECGHNWIEDYEDYFSDEDELNEILENGDGSIDCPECGGNDIKWKDVNIIEENKSNLKETSYFDSMDFEQNIPHKMRFKEYDVVDYNNLYWVTQEPFSNKDLEEFVNAFKNTPFTKAYITVRDFSTYDFDKDKNANVFAIVDKSGIVDTSGYDKALKDAGWYEYLNEKNSSLKEDYSEKLGGDPEDFISDVQTILDTLNQIDTSSFGTHLAQQMIEDWVETCERQIEKGKRLASGNEFYSESSLTEDDNDIMRLVKKSIKNGKLPDEIKYKDKIYKSFYVMNSDNSGETSDIYYCNMENTPSGDPQESNDYFFVKVALNKTDRGYNGIKEIRFVEDLTEGCSKQKINEDEYGDNPIKTNDKYQLYKSMKGTDIDGVTYSSYLVRDNNGNGVRSFIAKNDIEAERKFNESSINEDSIEDNDLILQNLIKFLEDNNIDRKNIEENIAKIEKYLEANNIGVVQYIPGVYKVANKNGTIGRIYCYSNGKWGSSTSSTVIEPKEIIDEAEENTEIDWDKPRYGDNILDNMWTAVCSNDLNYVKNAFNKNMIKPNTRYQTGTGKHSLIMGALRNNNFEMVDLLKSFGEKIQKSELEEYKNIMSSREYEDDLTKSSIEEAEEMQVKNLQVIKEQGNVYMLEDENKKMIVGENYNAKEGIIENAEIYENKNEADKDYLNRCEILKGGEKLKSKNKSDELNEAKTVKEYRIIDTTDNKVLKTFKTEDKEKGYTEMRKMSKKLKDEGKKDNLIYKEYKVKK